MSDHVRVIPVLCVQTARHYGQGMTMTTMCIIQLFIIKDLAKYKYQKSNVRYLINIYYCYLFWPESGNNLL